ncbi:hypothetical protein GOP47_0012398 [Adiantum capillus-veneris]|uniref:Branchpoint-bridging protein n=1 Tax=Adiantum capillus-veneris TaxID=13818 RepID=A0A9D4ZFN1_ADICA|nr:hypothetical protein GOP47_0012398 [Adiantum capillus-veneris]
MLCACARSLSIGEAPSRFAAGGPSSAGKLYQTTSVAPPSEANLALTVEGDLAFAKNKPSEELRAKQELFGENRPKQSPMATTGNATAVAESPRVSKMVKSGLNFVIPKNKLLGAMVPVNRSATKWEPLEPKKEELKPPARKTKWGPDLTQDAVVKKGRALALQTRAEQLAAQLESGNLDIDSNEETRSPSPPPLYDTLGHRMNTREGRKREQLDLERREAIGECMKLNSQYKPPSGYKPVAKEAKLYIPAKEHPGYNFIGLILGPRGNTQKRMEAESGAKITIRGKGAVKEGKIQSIRNGKDTDGASEELHVHISSDSFEKVDAAVALIEPLLTPVDEDRNMHKMKQLRELAEMNGTLNDFTKVCSLCGEAGHTEWHCPKEKLQNFQANVLCNICGDGGHPSIDCPRKNSGQGATFDKEYMNFLEELGTGLEGGGTSEMGDQSSGPNVSQPMLLTSLGAQPIPSRWMAPLVGADPSGISTPRGPPIGASDGGAFLRFPAPLMSQGMKAFNPFVARFFQPSVPIRGHPFPGGPMPMMVNMLPAFRGQSPGPAGLASPAIAVAPLSTNSTMPVQTQEFRSAGETLNVNAGLPTGSQSVSNAQDGGTNAVALATSSVAPSFAIPSTSNTNSQFTLGPPLNVSTGATLGQIFPSTSASNLLPLESGHRILAPASVCAVSPSPAVIPPIRPVIPSIRPALPGPLVQQGSSGLGQALPHGIPSTGGTGNLVPVHANNSFPRPSQPLPGAETFWPRPPQQVASSFDRPPPPSAIPLMPQPLASSNNQPLQPPIRGSSPALMAGPMQGHSIIRAPPNSNMPPMSSSFIALPPQNQFAMTPNNQLMMSQPSSHPGLRPGFPQLLGSQMRPVNPGNVILSGGMSASIQQIPQQSIFRLPQEFPRTSELQNTQFTQQSNSFPHRAEFPPLRPPMGAQTRPDFRSPGVQHQQGILVSPPSILGSPAFSRPPLLGPPQEAFNRAFNPNILSPRNPAPNFPGGVGAINATWDPNRNRPDMQQINGRPAMAGMRGWNPEAQMRPQVLHASRPQMQEVDPEYEKLMASVGVL